MNTPDLRKTRTVSLALNQQQLELLDRTIQSGLAGSREDLVRLALAETIERKGQ